VHCTIYLVLLATTLYFIFYMYFLYIISKKDTRMTSFSGTSGTQFVNFFRCFLAGSSSAAYYSTPAEEPAADTYGSYTNSPFIRNTWHVHAPITDQHLKTSWFGHQKLTNKIMELSIRSVWESTTAQLSKVNIAYQKSMNHMYLYIYKCYWSLIPVIGIHGTVVGTALF
jgi:hypothetical protein